MLFAVHVRKLQVQGAEEQGGNGPRCHVEPGHHEQLHTGGKVPLCADAGIQFTTRTNKHRYLFYNICLR